MSAQPPTLLERVRRWPSDKANAYKVKSLKHRAMDVAFGELGARSFADLGAVWHVDARYTFRALRHHPIERAFVVDTDYTEAVHEKAKAYPQLELVEGYFGARDVIERIAPVDTVFLFDVLLHQVDPDWDEILERWAGATRSMVVVNAQWTGDPRTVRLLELGEDAYFENVPAPMHDPGLFDRLDDLHPQHGRRWRDVHNIWQWGITTADLDLKFDELGFRRVHHESSGQYEDLPRFDYEAFVFARD